jgi:predicted O-methyltransferase YrrM
VILPNGWLTDEEATELCRVATDKTVLELGAWKGRSTVVFSHVAHHVVSVDRLKGIEEVGGKDSLPEYLKAVRHLENVTIVVSEFDKVIPLFRQEFDVVYVDGEHDTQSAINDIYFSLAVVKEDGLVVLHDFDFESVQTAANETFGCVPDSIVGSIAVFSLIGER